MNKLYYACAHSNVGNIEYYICAKGKNQVKDIILEKLKDHHFYLASEEDIENNVYKSYEDLYNKFYVEYIGIASKKIKVNCIMKAYTMLYYT